MVLNLRWVRWDWASWAELNTNRSANQKAAWSGVGGLEIRTTWKWTSHFRSKMDLNRPELDKPPEQDVQYEVFVISGPKGPPETDLKMECPHPEPYPRYVVVIGLTYKQT